MRVPRVGYLALVVAAMCFIAPSFAPSSRMSAQQAGAQPSGAAPAPRAVLDKYCVTCHNERVKTAGLMLDKLDLAHVADSSDTWEKVVRKIRTGAMPPAGRPRPDKVTSLGVATWLEGELDRAAVEHPNPGRPTLHRLNRAEYTNAIRELLALEIDAASMLPGDSAGYGFDNNADALSMSPALTERYLGAAAKISQMALARVRGLPSPETFFVPTDRNQGIRYSDDLPWGSRGGIAIRYYFPVDGEYEFQGALTQGGAGGEIIGVTEEPQQFVLRIENSKVATTTIGGPEMARTRGYQRPQPAPQPASPQQTPPQPQTPEQRQQQAQREQQQQEQARAAREKKILEALKFRVQVKAGEHLVQGYFVARTSAVLEDLFDPYLRRDPYRAGNGEPTLSSLTVTPPNASETASVDSPTRRRLLVCRPASASETDACAKRIISNLARRAYRRPVTEADLEIPLARYRDGASAAGSQAFESGLEMAIRSILVSPKFLFRFETQPANAAPNTVFRITDLELASRLSFFIWSSIPDDELLGLAEKKTLHTPAVLEQQIRRMLTDPRSEALVTNFAGQWLQTRNVQGFRPSPELLFHFDDNLRLAFERETELFFESIVRENRSVLDLLDADYTYLNERLAKHYGIPGVYGERFRRVSLPADSPRRGLLGQGSILTGTSRANRTSPVIRGKWILENVFGAPPPPPPPNVPELKEERDPTKVLPMREQMAAHRANPVCAACHAQMDQLGFALENFDAIGEWRDTDQNKKPIDASAQLPDGTKFNGPIELRKVLLSHSDDFLTTVTERLLTYALGRGVEAADVPAIRRIKRDAASANYKFASLIQGVVTSTPFQMSMTPASTN
jgi:mono/diheme cytochrome c family protein